MGRLFGLVLMLISLYIGMTVYTKGIEHAFGGVLAPIQPVQSRDTPFATDLTPAAGLADAPAEPVRPVRVTDAVRSQVSSDLEAGAGRRGYDPDR